MARWSEVACARIAGVAAAVPKIEAELDEAKAAEKQAKDALEESREALDQAIQAAAEKHGNNTAWPEEDTKAITGLQKDVRRRETTAELKNREKIQKSRRLKKQHETILELINWADAGDEDLFATVAEARGEMTPLAQVDKRLAAAFVAVGIDTIKSFLDAVEDRTVAKMIREGEATAADADALERKAEAFLVAGRPEQGSKKKRTKKKGGKKKRSKKKAG